MDWCENLVLRRSDLREALDVVDEVVELVEEMVDKEQSGKFPHEKGIDESDPLILTLFQEKCSLSSFVH